MTRKIQSTLLALACTAVFGAQAHAVTHFQDPLDQLVISPAELTSKINAVYNGYGASQADKNELKIRGILNVTKPPYNADPADNANDDTAAIQRAVYDARNYGAVCFFPTGTYSITDQISCPNPGVTLDEAKTRSDYAEARLHPCVLVGDRSGPRPTIKLSSAAAGFGNSSNPKEMLYFWAVEMPDPNPAAPIPNQNQANRAFEHRLEYVKLDTGGYAGAGGVYMRAAQGSVIEDVEIVATSSYAGVTGIPGSGGSIHGLLVQGGRYGIIGEAQAGPTVANATLLGQTVNSVLDDNMVGPLTMVGCRIQKSSAGEAIYCTGSRSWANLIDCQIELSPPATTAIRGNKGVYLSNVYVQNAATIVNHTSRPDLTGAASGWRQVREYANSDVAVTTAPRYLNGVAQTINDMLKDVVTVAGPPSDLISRHAPTTAALPHFYDPDIIDVTAAPYGANGFDTNEDRAAIQSAINAARDSGKNKVFIPRGRFYLSAPLVLHKDTQLFGVHHMFTKISPKINSTYNNENLPNPLIDTDDDPDATTSIAGLWLDVMNASARGAYALRWRAGRNSYVRDCWYRSGAQAGPAFRDYPHVLITGSGGGRWYTNEPTNESSTSDQTLDFRSVKVDGTSEPLSFYQLNSPERCNGQSGVEIVNASNVSIYGIKHEDGHKNAPEALRATNSGNIRIFGHAGNGGKDMVAGDDMYHIENCENLIFANLAIMNAWQAIPTLPWDMIDETYGAGRVHISGDKTPVYFKRGTPSGCAPKFSTNSLTPNAEVNSPYSGFSLATGASDEDGLSSQLTFLLIDPASKWLVVAPDGTLSGTPKAADAGLNTFRVRVADAAGMYTDAQLQILVSDTDSAASGWTNFN